MVFLSCRKSTGTLLRNGYGVITNQALQNTIKAQRIVNWWFMF